MYCFTKRAEISETSCLRRWSTRSASSAVSKYQPPSRAAHQAVYCWQPCLSGCRSSSLERSARCRRLVSIADFSLSLKSSSFPTFIPSPDYWPFDWHRYSDPCSTVRYLGHSKNLRLLTYLLTYLLIWYTIHCCFPQWRIFKIGERLMKLLQKVRHHVF